MRATKTPTRGEKEKKSRVEAGCGVSMFSATEVCTRSGCGVVPLASPLSFLLPLVILFVLPDWTHATYDSVFKGSDDTAWAYTAAKTLAETAAWDFASSKPDFDLATGDHLHCPSRSNSNPPFCSPPNVAVRALCSRTRHPLLRRPQQ